MFSYLLLCEYGTREEVREQLGGVGSLPPSAAERWFFQAAVAI